MFSAKGAAFNHSLGQRPRGLVPNAFSAESAIQCGRPFVPATERCKTHQIETRFQRCSAGNLKSWAMPQAK